MANRHRKDLLDALHQRLRREWREHLRRQPTTELGIEAAELIRDERSLRDRVMAENALRRQRPD